MGWNDCSLPAVGERYDNEDGSSRQLEIMCMLPGDPVALVRQPDNPHDHMAVAISPLPAGHASATSGG
jgi:hypothetical protein